MQIEAVEKDWIRGLLSSEVQETSTADSESCSLTSKAITESLDGYRTTRRDRPYLQYFKIHCGAHVE
jgi:hypothetical protein